MKLVQSQTDQKLRPVVKEVLASRRAPVRKVVASAWDLLVTPATARDIKLIASLKGTSVNSIANKLLENYIKSYGRKNPNKLKSAKELFK